MGKRKRISGAGLGFQVRGGHLKKLRRAEGGANIFGVFRVKNHDFMPKNIFFSNFRGARTGCTPGSAPGYSHRDRQRSTKHCTENERTSHTNPLNTRREPRFSGIYRYVPCVQNLNVIKYNELKIEAIEP